MEKCSRANAHTSGNAFAFCIQVLIGFDMESIVIVDIG